MEQVIRHDDGTYEPLVLTVKEAAALLRIPRAAAYSKISSGTFPVRVLKVGSRLKVPTQALMTYVETQDDRGAA